MKTYDVTVEVSFVITRRVRSDWPPKAQAQVMAEALKIVKTLNRDARARVLECEEVQK